MLTLFKTGPICFNLSQKDTALLAIILFFLPVGTLIGISLIKYLIKKPQRSFRIKRILLILQTASFLTALSLIAVSYFLASNVISNEDPSTCEYDMDKNIFSEVLLVISEVLLFVSAILFISHVVIGITTMFKRTSLQ